MNPSHNSKKTPMNRSKNNLVFLSSFRESFRSNLKALNLNDKKVWATGKEDDFFIDADGTQVYVEGRSFKIDFTPEDTLPTVFIFIEETDKIVPYKALSVEFVFKLFERIEKEGRAYL